jgi:hypothetical protein
LFTLSSHRYGLVTDQKKGAYKYFVDLDEGMEVVTVRTAYIDEVYQLFFQDPIRKLIISFAGPRSGSGKVKVAVWYVPRSDFGSRG